MGIHIVLYQPEIPANTGNIARTCLATNTTLHLIRPLGFSTDNKMLRRAGLDYWKDVQVYEYDSLDDLYAQYPTSEFYYIEDVGEQYYTDGNYQRADEPLFFVFGRETSGIPQEVIAGKEEKCMKIPMTDNVRSLNLSNAVAIVLFEVLRQQCFPRLK